MDWKAFQTIMVALVLVMLLSFGIKFAANSKLAANKAKRPTKKKTKKQKTIAIPLTSQYGSLLPGKKYFSTPGFTGAAPTSAAGQTYLSGAKPVFSQMSEFDQQTVTTPSGKTLTFGNDDVMTDSRGNRYVFANDDDGNDDENDDDNDDENDDENDESISFDSAQTMLETLAGK